MELLPLRTQPPQTPTYRRHNPSYLARKGGYQEYKPCLRWDFGFICAFCLLHEVDICPQGTSGLPVFSAEHLELQSTDDQKANDYGNVVYACSFCNTARRSKPRVTPEARLLDPTKDVWAQHFRNQENYLVPQEHDADAIYTHEAYDLDDDRKVARRETRYETLSANVKIIKEGSAFLKELFDRVGKNPDKFFIETTRQLRASILQALKNLEPYAAIPKDAPTQCRCRTRDMHSLPEEFAKQIMQISSPASV